MEIWVGSQSQHDLTKLAALSRPMTGDEELKSAGYATHAGARWSNMVLAEHPSGVSLVGGRDSDAGSLVEWMEAMILCIGCLHSRPSSNINTTRLEICKILPDESSASNSNLHTLAQTLGNL